MKSGMLIAQIQWNQQAKFQGEYWILTGSLATWSVQQLLVSTASPSLFGDGWNQVQHRRESLTKWKIIRNASISSKSVWKYALSPPLIITTQNCQWSLLFLYDSYLARVGPVDKTACGGPVMIGQSAACLATQQTVSGHIPPMKIPLISFWHWITQRRYKVLSDISTNIAW